MATTQNITNTNLPYAWASSQPNEINFLKPNAFRFKIQSLPLTSYFVQSANIPDIKIGVAMQATPLVDIPHPGDKMVFDELSITFLVQESLENYNELYTWISGLGFDLSNQQFVDYVNSQSYKMAGINVAKSELPQLSDASLVLLDALNNPIAAYNFIDCFPTSLSGLEFDMSGGETTYITSTATFRFLAYTFLPITPPT